LSSWLWFGFEFKILSREIKRVNRYDGKANNEQVKTLRRSRLLEKHKRKYGLSKHSVQKWSVLELNNLSFMVEAIQ
jgi:hypothetical protein